MRWLARVFRRTVIALLTVLIASIIVWSLLLLAPGDPAEQVLRARGVQEPDPDDVIGIRGELGLDGSLVSRFSRWLADVCRGDFGYSWKSGRPVMEEFATRLPATLRLTLAALIIGIVLALLLGLLSAAAPRRWPDWIARGISLISVVTPGFLVGLFILNVLVLKLGLGNIIGDGSWATVGWPALTLALGSAGYWSRILRAAILESDTASYMDVCRIRGAKRSREIVHHLLPNAAGPFLTVVGLGAAALIGGAPIVESVFSWPGIGKFAVQAINGRDQPVVAAFTMISVFAYVAVSIFVDMLAMVIDPRLRQEKQASKESVEILSEESL